MLFWDFSLDFPSSVFRRPPPPFGKLLWNGKIPKAPGSLSQGLPGTKGHVPGSPGSSFGWRPLEGALETGTLEAERTRNRVYPELAALNRDPDA